MFGDAKESLRLCGLAHDSHSSGLLSFLRHIGRCRQYDDWNIGKKRIFHLFSEKTPSVEGITKSKKIAPAGVSAVNNRNASMP
jgi:hypothetical protein